MLFFGKKNSDKAKPVPGTKPTITVGRLFNPEIGSTLRPLGDTGKLLIDLIATIFVAHGLFPRNHPGLIRGSAVKLRFAEVMTTGWRHLSFTREGLPAVLIFAAVVMSLTCSVLAILVGLLAAFSGTAHAAPTGGGMFTPVDPGGDIACGWINWLFNMSTNGCILPDYLSDATGGQQTLANLQSSAVQTALITALGFYSDAILIVAAVVLFYHLVSMVVETAHHGVVMGRRASQVWAPIRLVVAVGLLVPVASGLNSGQFIVIQMAQWGSGLASQTWNQFLNALVTDSGKLSDSNAPYVRQVVTDVVMMEACAYAFDQLNASEVTNNGGSALVANKITIPPDGCVDFNDGSQGTGASGKKCSYQPRGAGTGGGGSTKAEMKDVDLCGLYIKRGAISVGTNATAIEQSLVSAQTQANSAFDNMQTAARNYAIAGMKNFVPQVDGGNEGGNVSANTDFETIVNDYQKELQNAASSVSGSFSAALSSIANTSSSQGWVSAGSWFNTIARVVGAISGAVRDLLPHTTPPKVDKVTQQNKLNKFNVEKSLTDKMIEFQQWFNNETSSTVGGGSGTNNLQLAAAGMAQSGGTTTHVMDYIFWLIDWIASYDGVWTPAGNYNQATHLTPQNFTLGVMFTSANPLAEIANLGHANINAAYDIFDAYLFLQAAAGGLQEFAAITGAGNSLKYVGVVTSLLSVLGTLGAAAASAVGGLLGTITVVFFLAGFMLAYFLPLIPFMRFLFGVIGWFLSLLEAIIAVPLVALAHLTPEGEGLPGEKAKAAYYMIFNLFLKPVLMVFGLIAGLLIFNIAASAMNLLYTIAVVGTGGISHGHVTLARLVYSILYVVILYLLCNNCFKLIDWLPEHCIKWMGAQGLHHPQMGDPAEVGQYMTLAAGYVESKIVGGAGELMKAGGPLALGALAQTGATQGMPGAMQRLGNIGGGGMGDKFGSAAQDYINASQWLSQHGAEYGLKAGQGVKDFGAWVGQWKVWNAGGQKGAPPMPKPENSTTP